MDVNQIEAVLIILITNALEVMNNKGVIFIRVTEYKDEIILEIEDTGDGIPLELLSKLFEPTYLQRKTVHVWDCQRVNE